MAKGNCKEIIDLKMFLNQFKAKIINTYQQMVLSDAAIYIVACPRVDVAYAREHADLPWWFFVKVNKYVSKPNKI